MDKCYESTKEWYRGLIEQGIWWTDEGKVLKISDMSNHHIVNSYNMICQTGSILLKGYLPVFVNELKHRKKRKREITVHAPQLENVSLHDWWFWDGTKNW